MKSAIGTLATATSLTAKSEGRRSDLVLGFVLVMGGLAIALLEAGI